jgi:hypothetical protein
LEYFIKFKYYFFVLIITIVYGFFVKKNLEKPFLLLYKYIIFVFIIEVSAQLLLKYVYTNSYIFHFSTLIEYYFYTLIYKSLIGNVKTNQLITSSFWVLSLFAALNLMFLQPINISNTNIVLIENLFLTILSLILFNSIRQNALFKNILIEEAFWFNCAIFLFYTLNLIISGLYGLKIYLINSHYPLKTLLYFMCIFLYTSFLFAIYQNSKKTKLKII